MTSLNKWKIFVSLMVGIWGFAGCAQMGSTTVGSGGTYINPDEQLVMTAGLDDHDYDLVARAVSDEFKKRGLPKDYVVVLGPVDTSETTNPVRVTQLQKSLQAIFNQEGSIKFMVLANSKPGETVEQAISNLRKMNWEIKNPIDQQDADIYGSTARVKGVLYGRVSSMENLTPDGRAKVIMYRFVWELSNTQTGINDITFEYKGIAKKIAIRR